MFNPNQQYLFAWKALNADGVYHHGKYFAQNHAAVKEYLQQKQLIPLKIQRQFQLINQNKNLSMSDLAQFTHQLSILIDANIPIVECFSLLENAIENPRLQMIIRQIAEQLTKGQSLQVSFNQHKGYFPNLLLSFVTIGEQTGKLANLLQCLSSYYQKQSNIANKIRKALWYPAAVVIIASLVCVIMLDFVIPQLTSLFSSSGHALPWLTQFIIKFAANFRNYQIELLFIILCTGVFILRYPKKFKFLCYYLIKIPILKRIVEYTTLTHFAQTLAISFAAGVSLLESLPLILQASSDAILKTKIDSICSHLKNGHSLHHALMITRYFPSLFLQGIAIGESTGTLEIMLHKTSHYYETKLNQAIDSFIALLEPSLILILGLIVGFLLIALYLPLFNLASVI